MLSIARKFAYLLEKQTTWKRVEEFSTVRGSSVRWLNNVSFPRQCGPSATPARFNSEHIPKVPNERRMVLELEGNRRAPAAME